MSGRFCSMTAADGRIPRRRGLRPPSRHLRSRAPWYSKPASTETSCLFTVRGEGPVVGGNEAHAEGFSLVVLCRYPIPQVFRQLVDEHHPLRAPSEPRLQDEVAANIRICDLDDGNAHLFETAVVSDPAKS